MTNAGQYILLSVIVCMSGCLLLANLGNQCLWDDEAQTALISKTILTCGVPRGTDGRNYFTQEEDAEYGKNYIWRWHTWLPFYVLAGFYKVFGVSTFVSRLPFAFFGLGTVLLTYLFAGQLWPRSRIPAIAAALLAISVPFLLMCRQCRYYSLTIFFSLLSLYAYAMLLQRKKYAGVLLLIASTLLFHSLHVYIGVLFTALLLHAVIFHRDRLKLLAIVIAVNLLFNGVWLFWLNGNLPVSFVMLHYLPILFHIVRQYAAYMVHYMFPAWLLALGIAVVIIKFLRAGIPFRQVWIILEKVSLPAFFIIFNIVVVAIAAPTTYFRYIAPSIPLVIILTAIIVDAVWDIHWLASAATVVILIATSQFKDYLYEITHDYDGPVEGISRYLNEHGSPDDIVIAERSATSLKFHTSMKVVSDYDDKEREIAKNARWIILWRDSGEGVWKIIDRNRCRRIELNYPDIRWENREDPAEHLFRTSTTADKVVIYERIN